MTGFFVSLEFLVKKNHHVLDHAHRLLGTYNELARGHMHGCKRQMGTKVGGERERWGKKIGIKLWISAYAY